MRCICLRGLCVVVCICVHTRDTGYSPAQDDTSERGHIKQHEELHFSVRSCCDGADNDICVVGYKEYVPAWWITGRCPT